MPETFSLPIYGNKEEKLRQLKRRASQYGIIVIGDTSRGTFSGDTMLGQVSGKYTVFENVVTVTLFSRPFLFSLERIRNEFSKFLADQ